ncbi:phosphoribosyltransferase [Patescibacteria group bacterium]|nr:phosphoribosyltransferase [Patescibacteria group bacterium]
MTFPDRVEAGKKLASELQQKYSNVPNAIVVALPRGGLPLGYEVAKAMNIPLDIVVPRKIGAPGHDEYAIGALTEIGEPIFNESEKERFNQDAIEKIVAEEKKEARRRLGLYRGKSKPLNLKDKTVFLVDDGIATGLTMRAAILSCKAKEAKKIIVAVPVASKEALDTIEKEVDDVVCLYEPRFFMAVGQFYEVFPQTKDSEVIETMKKYHSF